MDLQTGGEHVTRYAQNGAVVGPRAVPMPRSSEVVADTLDPLLLGDRPVLGGRLVDVAVVGLGYVGLPTALAFHESGRAVLGLDISTARLANVRHQAVDLTGRDHDRLAAALDDERFLLAADLSLISQAEAVIVCVPTPIDDHFVPDMQALAAACACVVMHARPGQTIVLTSTTYAGCTRDLLVEPLRSKGLLPGVDVHVSFSPERIDPGSKVPHEEVPRVVGGATAACASAAGRVLQGYGAAVHLVSSLEAAEMTKLLENTFRAVNIAFVNEMSDLARTLGLDIMEVIQAAATKPYGYMPFLPGPGVGGHCIPCDPHYLLWQMRARRERAPLIEAAMAGIAGRPRKVVERARGILAEDGLPLNGAVVRVVGVTYKPGVADVRESPALEIIAELRDAGVRVSYLDPLVPSLRLRDGTVLRSSDEREPVDLVILHTLQPDLPDWALSSDSLVLDTTYRLRGAPTRLPL